MTELSLKALKDIADSAPKAIKEGLLKDEAETFKNQLQEVGPEVKIN